MTPRQINSQVRFFTAQQHERFENGRWIRIESEPPAEKRINEWAQSNSAWIQHVSLGLVAREDRNANPPERVTLINFLVTWMPIDDWIALHASLGTDAPSRPSVSGVDEVPVDPFSLLNGALEDRQ